MGNWEAGFEGPDPVSQIVKSPQTFRNSLEGGSELEKCASHSLLIHLPPTPNFLAGQSTPVIFKLLRPPCVPSLTSPQMTLPETVTGRLTPDAAGQGAWSPHSQITRGRRVAVKSDYRMWISPELRGGPSGPRQAERGAGRQGPPRALGCGLPGVEEPRGKGSLFSTSTCAQCPEHTLPHPRG